MTREELIEAIVLKSMSRQTKNKMNTRALDKINRRIKNPGNLISQRENSLRATDSAHIRPSIGSGVLQVSRYPVRNAVWFRKHKKILPVPSDLG